jgi:hypothetical protein
MARDTSELTDEQWEKQHPYYLRRRYSITMYRAFFHAACLLITLRQL